MVQTNIRHITDNTVFRFFLIFKDNMYNTEIMKAMDVSHSAVYVLRDEMIKNGFIEYVKQNKKTRAKRLKLTELGKQIQDKVKDINVLYKNQKLYI